MITIIIFTAEAQSTQRTNIICFPLSPAKDQRDASKGGKQKTASLKGLSDTIKIKTFPPIIPMYARL
jgi:hypothetical protein